MLDQEMTKKIENFVYSQPRSVQEIAQHVDKNWRTVDRYVQEIEKGFGTISTKVFRGGTRGALKVVYWAAIEKASSSVFQKELETEILKGKDKRDFSAFDIFQHVPDKKKRAIIEKEINEDSTNLKELRDLLAKAKKQVIFLSGNLSFINLGKKRFDMLKIIEELIERDVEVKIISRVDLAGRENIEKVLSLNFKHGKELIEIRHREQPIRGVIIDDDVLRLKEVKEPTGKIKELDKKLFIFYTIKDKEWVSWIKKIFWNMFSGSVGSKKRLEEIEKLKN
jgi:hypothetical protein